MKVKLWPHQHRGLVELSNALAAGERNICVTSPTGGGKSHLMFTQMLNSGLPTALYTDRRMLLKQLSKNLDDRGMIHGVRAADYAPSLLSDIQLCMVQTEASRSLDGDRTVHNCPQVIIDEAHKMGGPSMVSLLGEHRKLNEDVATIGFTATPLGIGHVYSKLIIAGTNSELRQCGAHVPAHHYGPDEPDQKWIGKIAIGEGECGLPNRKRMEFAQRVYGSVVKNYIELNPEQKPAVLFAPGVKESIWFAEHLSDEGIEAAHIDGENVWLDGRLLPKTDALVEEIESRCKSGSIKVVCNRFVLREGIDWKFLYHGIFATVFGSLTSYIQAGGRLLRSHPSMDHVVIQDHGGNWWRHGSLNSDREWNLGYTDRIMAGMREKRIRDKKEPEPITCPKCHAIRMSGPQCHDCGFKYEKRVRPVLQKDGTLREAKGDIFKQRRTMERNDEYYERSWAGYVKACRKSKKPKVRDATMAQLEVWWARNNNWKYPNRDWGYMPTQDADWFRPHTEVVLKGESRQPDFSNLPSVKSF